jgi:flagellar hook-associated protein 3 FlgL
MRATESISVRSVLDSIQGSYSLLAKYQKQVANGKRINVPSDDPIGLYRIHGFATSIDELTQYAANITSTLDEMNAVADVMGNMLDRLLTVKGIITQAGNEIYNQSQLDTFAYQIEQILNQMIDQGNFAINDKYVFAGFQTDTKPFVAAYLGGYINTVTYNGDTGQREVQVNTGRTDTINMAGDNTADNTVPGVFVDVNAPAKNIFNALIQFRDDLFAGNFANIRTTDATALSQYTSYLESLAGQFAVKIQELMELKDTHEAGIIFKRELRAHVEEADAFEAISNMSNQEVAYQAALKVGARVVSQNLFDFMG